MTFNHLVEGNMCVPSDVRRLIFEGYVLSMFLKQAQKLKGKKEE